ncbi:trypsin-like peptidase domain-containing protein [Pseudofrankia sp. BMG5.37]|nr:trypsin-like peptidase domain-containing protein [Pseudofrankia sp. BMG5.37]
MAAQMQADWLQAPPWLVRILGPDGAVGGGVYVGDGFVLTAAHVYRDAGDEVHQLKVALYSGQGGSPPGDWPTIQVRFEHAQDNEAKPAELRYVSWPGRVATESADCAVLHVTDVPPAAVPAPLRRPESFDGHTFRIFGYPADTQGVWSFGQRIGGSRGRLVQLQSGDSTGEAVTQGFSGCPVWDETASAVVGTAVTEYDAAKKVASMTPMKEWAQVWPELESRFRWRLDMAEDFEDWLRLARGPGVGSAAGLAQSAPFTGRARVLGALADWLTAPPGPDRQLVRIVTGRPGAGKSAVLARLVWLADPVVGPSSGRVHDPVPAPDELALAGRLRGLIDVAVRADGKSTGDLIEAMAAALELTTTSKTRLIRALEQRTQPFTVVVDDLEHAQDVNGIARLLRELAQLPQGGGVRVITAIRTDAQDVAGALPLAGPARDPQAPGAPADAADAAPKPGLLGEVISYRLDDRYLDRADLENYAAARLRTALDQAGEAYLGDDGYTAVVAAAIADKADGLFLLAQLTCDRLRIDDPVDVSAPGWRARLPGTLQGAVEDYLYSYAQRWGEAKGAALRDVLTTFAYGRGDGFAADELCAAVASTLGSRSYDLPTVKEAARAAAAYLVGRRSGDAGQIHYRLFHRLVVGYLRDASGSETERVIVKTMADRVPATDAGPDWLRADDYTRRHLAGHAEDAGLLGNYLTDPRFLAAADPEGLVTRVFRRERLEPLEQIYLSAVHRSRDLPDPDKASASRRPGRIHRWLRGASGSDRAGYLALHALAYDRRAEAAAFDALQATPAFVTRWAGLQLQSPHLVLAEHSASITTAATLSIADRPAVATASQDATARIWDLATGDLHATMAGPDTGMTALATAPSGAHGGPRLITGSADGTIQIWDPEAGRLMATFAGHLDSVGKTPVAVDQIAVTASETGPLAVSVARYDALIRVWDLATGKPRTSLDNDARSASRVTTALIGGVPLAISTGDDDGALHVWDLVAGTHLQALTGHDGPVGAVEITTWPGGAGARAGQPVAVSAGLDGTVRVWTVPDGSADGAQIRMLSGGADTGGWAEYGVALTVGAVDGATWAVAGGYGGRILGWDLASGEPVPVPVAFGSHGVWALSLVEPRADAGSPQTDVIPDQPLLLVAGQDPAVRMWSLGPLDATPRPALTQHGGDVFVARVADVDGRRVAVTAGEDSQVRLWHLATVPTMAERAGPGETRALAVAVSADESLTPSVVVTGGRDGHVRAWNLDDGSVLHDLGSHTGPVHGVTIARHHDRRWVLSAAAAYSMPVWDADSGAQVGTLDTPTEDGWPTSLLVCQQGAALVAVVTGSSGITRVWDIATTTSVGTFTAGGAQATRVFPVADVPDHRVVLADADGAVWLWDLDAVGAAGGCGAGRRLLDHQGKATVLTSLAATSTGDGVTVLAGYEDGTVGLFLPAAPPAQRALRLRRHAVSVRATAIVPGQALAVTADDDGRVIFWNLDQAQPVADFPPRGAAVRAVVTTTVGARPRVVTADDDGVVRAWDLLPPRQVAAAVLTEAVTCLVAVDNGVVAGTRSGHARLDLRL